MSASLLFKPVINAVLPSNEIAPSAELYSYKAGSTALYPLYLDEDNITAASNPVIADASGEFPPLFTDDGQDYKLILREAGAPGIEGAVLWEIDNYGRIGRTNEIVATSRIEDFYGLDATIAPNLTVTVPIASDEILKTPQAGIDAVESWKVPPSSQVILQLKDETILHPARIAEYAVESDDNIKLKGAAPLTKEIAPSGHSAVGTVPGAYSVTFRLDDVNDLRVGHYVYILDNDEFQRLPSKRCFVKYDQSRPRWVFTEIQAATPNSATVPEGFVMTDSTAEGEDGTRVTLLRRFRDEDESSDTFGALLYEPSSLVNASDYITAGEVFFVNGQMREIISVPETGPTFIIATALDADLPPSTYWYTLVNKAGTFTQSGGDITGVGTRFTDYQIGDLMAHDGAFNPITSITDDFTMTVAAHKAQSTAAKFSIVRTGGAFAGLHPITNVDVVNSTITFSLRAFYSLSDMAIPIKGITGGTVKIVRSVLETTGTVGGVFVDGRNFTYGDLVIKGPVVDVASRDAAGVGIDPKGQSGLNAGRVTFEGIGGTYGFNIGVDFGVGCVGKVQEQINYAAKFAGMRSDNSIVEADYSVTGGCGAYGVLTNNSNNNFNWAHQVGSKQGYLAATPCNTVADSMRQVGNFFLSVTIQAGSYHLVQFEALHCGSGPFVVNSNGRLTGTRVFGGKKPLVVTGGSLEARASTFSGYRGNGILVKGGTVDLLRSVIMASGPAVVKDPPLAQGTALSASKGCSVDLTRAKVKDTGAFVIADDAYADVSDSNIQPSISISDGGRVDAQNMAGSLATNLPLNDVQLTTGSIIRT